MARNFIYSFILILYFVGVGHSQENVNPSPIDIDFDNAPLQEVIFTVSEFSGVGFTWPGLNYSINWTQKNIPPEELITSFNDILSSYGLTALPLNNRTDFYSIQSRTHLSSGNESYAVYFPKFLAVESIEESLVNLFGNRLSFLAVPDNNCIFFTGSPSTIESFVSFINKIDKSSENFKITSFKLNHIPVKDALATLKNLDVEADILPDYWNKSILIRGSFQDISDITKSLIALDRPQTGQVEKLGFVSTIHPGQALPVLSGLYADIKINPVDEHKILLSGPAGQVNSALSMLNKLDGSNYQVKVEAVIASLTDTEFYELGLKISGEHEKNSNNFEYVLNPAFDTLLFNHGGLLVDYFSDLFGMSISAQDGVSHGEILSSPVLNVLNGHTARLHVGQNVPFLKKARVEEKSEEKEGIEIERHDVGLTFRITPFVDPDGQFIHLNLDQIVSAIQPETENSVEAADIITDKKELHTTVLAADGDTIFIGGLKSNEKGDSISKVPFLGDIPFLGSLFTYKAEKDITRHLVMSLRVNIIKRA